MPLLREKLTLYVKGDNNLFDSSGYGFHGTAVNSLDFAPGRINNGVNFDSDFAQSVIFGTTVPIGGRQKFSMGGWVRPTALSGFKTIAIKGAAVNTARTFIASGGGGVGDPSALMFGLANSANTYGHTAIGKLVVGTLVHIGVTFDGTFVDGTLAVQNAGRAKLYFNAVQQSLTFVGTIPATTALNAADNFRLGNGAGAPWDGVIDEFALWKDRVLTLADWQEIYAAGAGKPLSQWTQARTANLGPNRKHATHRR